MWETVMFWIFGKRWIRHDMLNGLRSAIFVNEMEVAMAKGKLKAAQEAKDQLEKEYADFLKSPLTNAVDLLPEEDKENERAIYDMEKKIKAERAEAIETFKTKLKSATTEIAVADAEVDRTYGITYSNRRKFDFIKGYKIVPTYADKSK